MLHDKQPLPRMHYNPAMPDITPQTPIYLSISVVLYRNEAQQLMRFKEALITAVATLGEQLPVAKVSLAVVDNAAHEGASTLASLFARLPGLDAVRFIQAECNLGYGRGHNRCLDYSADYHLILNPDVYLAPDALVEGLRYLQANPQVGMVAPYGENDDGEPLFLCKRYPAVLDFVLRGFAPAAVRSLFARRLAHYEMREVYLGNTPFNDVEIASGCCMLLRCALLKQLGGFSEAYFLYFEDFDLSVRLRQHAAIAFVPSMKIIHEGGQAARKGWRHIYLFASSGLRFFRECGWRWC
jgi:hypothetical protein